MTPLRRIADDAELDRLLRTHLDPSSEQLSPSSGFASTVMDALHQQLPAPVTIPPIAFPWKQVLPVAATLILALAAFILYLHSAPGSPLGLQITPVLNTLAARTLTLSAGAANTLVWTASAITLSLAAAAISFQLAGGRR